MGPGTIRCLAHSALPMLDEAVRLVRLAVIRTSRLSFQPLCAWLDAVTVAAGITTLRPILDHEGEQERERASAGCESPSGRAIWARSAAQNPRRTCCFRRRARRERSSTPLRSGVARSSSKVTHAFGL